MLKMGATTVTCCYGITLTMIASAHLAGRLVCIPDPRAGNPPLSDLLKEIQKQKGTILHCVPALYVDIVNHPNVNQYDLSRLKVCGSGAAPLVPNFWKKAGETEAVFRTIDGRRYFLSFR